MIRWSVNKKGPGYGAFQGVKYFIPLPPKEIEDKRNKLMDMTKHGGQDTLEQNEERTE